MSASAPKPDYLFKVLLIGDSGVGKTSILNRFLNGSYDVAPANKNVDYHTHTITSDGKVIKLQLWDTAGQERFRTLTTSYFRGAHGIIIVYDITNEESFTNVSKWMLEIQNYTFDGLSLLLAGNKVDLADKQLVPDSSAKEYATTNTMQFIEVSAKNGHNISQAFEALAVEMRKKNDAETVPSVAAPASSSVKVGGATGKKKSGCILM